MNHFVKLLFDHLKVQNETNQNFLSDLKQNKTTTSGEINISTGETFAVQFLSSIISLLIFTGDSNE